MSGAASYRVTRYLVPGLGGAAAAFAVRLVFADLSTALVGAAIFGVIYAVVLLLARALGWQDAPLQYAAICAFAVTIAFVATGPLA